MFQDNKKLILEQIIKYIDKNPNCTTKDIANAISHTKQVTLRTVQNYLKYLRDNWKDGKLISKRGRHKVEIYNKFQPKGLEHQTKIFLKLAIEHLENLTDLSNQHHKLIKELNLTNLQNPFFIKAEDYQNIDTGDEEIQELDTAIKNDTNIAFTFRGKDFYVEPYRLVNFDGLWYLYGRDIEEKEGNDHKTWLLKDIENIEVFYGEKYDTSDEEIEEDLQQAYSAHFIPDKEIKVLLKIDSQVADIFRQKKYLPNQHSKVQKDGSLLVTSIISTYADIDQEIKSWLPYIEILEPKEYRDKLKNELKHYLEKIYKQ